MKEAIKSYVSYIGHRVDKETGAVLRGSNGLCITCEPGEVGEMVGLVRVGEDPVVVVVVVVRGGGGWRSCFVLRTLLEGGRGGQTGNFL